MLFFKPTFVLLDSKEIENELMFHALSGRINIEKELPEFFQSLPLICSSWVYILRTFADSGYIYVDEIAIVILINKSYMLFKLTRFISISFCSNY